MATATLHKTFQLLAALVAVVLVAAAYFSLASAWLELRAGLAPTAEAVWVPIAAGLAELALVPFLFIGTLRPIAGALAAADFTTRAIVGLAGAAPAAGAFMLVMAAVTIAVAAVRLGVRAGRAEAAA
jgi:hypothetical protein